MTCPECGVLYDTAVADGCPLCLVLQLAEANADLAGKHADGIHELAEIAAKAVAKKKAR